MRGGNVAASPTDVQTETAPCSASPTPRFGALLLSALPAYAVKYSVTILQPPGYNYTTALGNSASNQVGYGALPGASNRALLWSGTPANAVDLTPVGYSASN